MAGAVSYGRKWCTDELSGDELLTHTHFPSVLLKPRGHLSGGNWRRPDQPHPGTRVRCCRCSLPGLTGFTTYRRGGTGGVTIVAGRIVASGWGMWQVTVMVKTLVRGSFYRHIHSPTLRNP